MTAAEAHPAPVPPRALTLQHLAGEACIHCGGSTGRLVSAGTREVESRSGASTVDAYPVKAHMRCPEVTQ